MLHMWLRAVAVISSVTTIAPASGQEFAAGNAASAPVNLLDRQAKLSVDEVPLQAALDELARQSAAPVAFSPSQLPDRLVSCDCASTSVAKALDQILEGTAATYREMFGQIVVSRSPAPAPPMPRERLTPAPTIMMANAISRSPVSLRDASWFPRAGSVTGVVREASTREAIRGAQISVANSPLQAVSDERGAYTLSNVPAGSVVLRVQGIGYALMERSVTVQDGETLKQDFELTRKAFELDAIVVTGTAGGTLTRAIGNVVSTVDASQILAAVPAPDVEQLLAARTPGVAVLPATGQVGTGAPLRIRGTNSMALVNEPIVFIDGVRIDSDPRQGPNQLTTSRVSRLNDLNPDDIQSIEIIKGPSAATLYGTEASNGVVQIITKRGASGRPQIDFSIRRGTNWLENPEERAGLRWWRDAAGQLQSINLYRQERLYGMGPIFHNGALQTYSANLSGGNPNMRYFASTSYDHDVGVVPWNWDKRISTRLNLDMSVSDKISARINTMYVDRKISLAQTNYNTDPFSNLVWGNPRTLNTPVRGFFRTPPEEWGEVESRADNSRITLGLELKHNPFRWFTHRLSTGLDRNDGDNVVLHPRQPEGASHFWGQQGLGQKVVDHAARQMVTLDYASSATWRPFGSMEFTTSGGFQYYQRQTRTITANGREFPAIPLTTVTAGGIKTAGETFEENATVGVYLQQQIAWRNRVFLTGAVRGDDNSAFGAQYDAAIYPKVSGTWVMNEE